MAAFASMELEVVRGGRRREEEEEVREHEQQLREHLGVQINGRPRRRYPAAT